MEENTGIAVNPESLEDENPEGQAESGIQQDYVSLDEILSGATTDNEAESPDAGGEETPSETVENLGDDSPAQETEPATNEEPTVYRTQAEFDAAFSKRMSKERAATRPLVELGRAVSEIAGGELTADEISAVVTAALADKRSKANRTDYDTEMNNIRVEQRVAKRFQTKAAAPTETDDNVVAARTTEMMNAIATIGDESFTVEALQSNQAALAAWASGATPSQVYRQFFVGGGKSEPVAPKPKRPAPERRANSGATGRPSTQLTEADIARIDAALASGKTVRL